LQWNLAGFNRSEKKKKKKNRKPEGARLGKDGIKRETKLERNKSLKDFIYKKKKKKNK